MLLGFFSLLVGLLGYLPVVTPPTISSTERGHHHEEGDGADDAHETDTGKDQTKPKKCHTKSNDFDESLRHKVHIYLEYHGVCLLVGIGTPPYPLPQASVPSPRNQGGGGGVGTLA